MKIAHLETGRHLYGGAQQVLTLLDGLKARGHENILYALETSEIVAPAVLRGHQVNPVQLAGDHDAGFIFRFRAHLKEDGPDLLHVHSRRGADTFGGVAARLAGVPAVLSRRVDNPLTRASASLRFWPYRRVIAISNAVANVLRGAGLGDERLAVIADAIDTSKLVLSPDMDWFRRAFHVAENAPVAGVVAQLIERKGHSELMQALPLVLGEHPGLEVIFFGRGPLEQELRMRAQAQGLEGAVRFAGFRNDLDRILPCLDMLIHPASAEGMGVAVLEAASAAIPVIAFAAGGIREAVVHGETGLLVPPGDIVGLADAIRTLLDDPELARRYGVAGRRRMETRFSVDDQVDAHLALYRQVLDGED